MSLYTSLRYHQIVTVFLGFPLESIYKLMFLLNNVVHHYNAVIFVFNFIWQRQLFIKKKTIKPFISSIIF